MNAVNPNDPLLKTGPAAERALFERVAAVLHGVPREMVVGIAINLLVNIIRESHDTRAKAEAAHDQIYGRAKTILVDHYDTLGRKRGVFPFDQVILVPRVDLRGRTEG